MQEGNHKWTAALSGFNEESSRYCRGINDRVAQEYAVEYATMIAERAKGIAVEPPAIRHTLFAPSRRRISSTLERMSEKYFPVEAPNPEDSQDSVKPQVSKTSKAAL